MAAVRSCVCLLVVLVYLQVAVSKPFFGWLMCDLLCTDDDISSSTTSTTEWDPLDDLFSFDCSNCPASAAATTARPAQSISLNLPSIPNGMRMNVTDNNGVLQFVLNAAEQMTAAGAAGAAPAAAPAAPAPAGNATAGAAPANATAAG